MLVLEMLEAGFKFMVVKIDVRGNGKSGERQGSSARASINIGRSGIEC